jgi:hypothetical protein
MTITVWRRRAYSQVRFAFERRVGDTGETCPERVQVGNA